MATLDDLTAQVAAIKTVSDSAVALINGLKVKLDEAIAGNPAPTNPDFQALSDAMAAATADLAAAVEANTPAP